MGKRWTLLIIVLSVLITNYISYLRSRAYDYNISSLEKNKIQFSKLPLDVKEFLLTGSKDKRNSYSFVSINGDSCRYEAQVYEYGPWVNGYRLIDLKSRVSYFMPSHSTCDFILFNDSLYILDDIYNYDIYRYNKSNIEELVFTRYKLKDKHPFIRMFVSSICNAGVYTVSESE